MTNCARILILRQHHGNHGQTLAPRKFEIALVMRGTAEDRAGAVIHQDEIRDQHGKLGALDHGMAHTKARIEALLLLRLELGRAGAVMMAFLDERLRAGIRLRHGFRQGMVRRNGDEARAEQSVGTRGEHLDQLVTLRRIDRLEADKQSLRSPDPVRLHQPHLLGPALERLQRIEQVLRIVGDLEHPLRLLALLDQRTRAPAPAVDHLLVGEHGAVDRVPIHLARLAVDEAGFAHVEKEALLLMVIIEVAGRELSRPVERQAHRLELAPHRGDVVVSPFGGMDATLDRRVLRRQPKGVPAHRVQHVVTLGAHIAGDDVAHRVIAHMAHVDAPRRVGEHLKNIVFRTWVILGGHEDPPPLPFGLPMLLAFRRVVTFRRHVLSPDCRTVLRGQSNPNAGNGQVTFAALPC